MERYTTDAQTNVFVVSSADAAELVSRSAHKESVLREIVAELLALEGHRRRKTKTTRKSKEEASQRFPGLPHDIVLRPRPNAFIPKLRRKHRRKWRIKTCKGNLQLLLAS